MDTEPLRRAGAAGHGTQVGGAAGSASRPAGDRAGVKSYRDQAPTPAPDQPTGAVPAPARLPDRELVRDFQATLDARRELGPEYEHDLVEGFVSRLEGTVDERVRAAVAAHDSEGNRPAIDPSRLALAIVSLGVGVPLTAIAASLGGLLPLLIIWVSIVVVNVAAGLSGRRR